MARLAAPGPTTTTGPAPYWLAGRAPVDFGPASGAPDPVPNLQFKFNTTTIKRVHKLAPGRQIDARQLDICAPNIPPAREMTEVKSRPARHRLTVSTSAPLRQLLMTPPAQPNPLAGSGASLVRLG